MDNLVTTDWLSEHIDDADLVTLECTVEVIPDESVGVRIESGRASYDGGHIAGAGFADLTGDLCDQQSPLAHMLPTPERFCAAMGDLGVGDDSRVVLYDRGQSMWAARVWWMLRWVGFDNAALLDGGFGRWQGEGRPVSSEPASRAAKTLTPRVRPQLIANRDEVLAAIDRDEVQLVDTLPPEMYAGGPSMYGRSGHIPGAVNVSAMDLVDETGCYKSRDAIAAMFEGKTAKRNITYCGGGILASSAAFAMTRLGLDDVAVYTASLQEWVQDAANPMVT